MFGRNKDSKAAKQAKKAGQQAAKAGTKDFAKLAPEFREIVFYAEGRHDWIHLGPIVGELCGRHSRQVTYLTSEADDPILTAPPAGVTALPVGDGMTRNMLFRTMDARLLITTLPDLEQLELKRSKLDVHYVYVFHALVSTHMVYREGAFDHYDTILTVGPHHDAEIRAREAQLGLPAKELVAHGYGRLDQLIESSGPGLPAQRTQGSGQPHVLVAASWGPNALMEHPAGRSVCDTLLDAGHRVTVRLHPMTVRHHPTLASDLIEEFAGRDGFVVETDLSDSSSLASSDVMISDWSGASFDFAFSELRPVIYIDMPAKVNNEAWQQLGIEPMERTVRHEIGAVVPPDDLGELVAHVERLVTEGDASSERLAQLRDHYIHNVGNSAQIAADWIAHALD